MKSETSRLSGQIGSIDTLESLREHLQWAIELEHCTIPPYLCALYSILPGRNIEASEVISSVLVEEMLHMTLAANLLNAVGGHPRLDSPRMLPGYPRCLPHGDNSFEIPLAPFSPETLDVFLRIEKPHPSDGLPEGDRYETIGQFYDAIEEGLRRLCNQLGEQAVFCGDPALQVTDDSYFGPGQLASITNLSSAIGAMNEVIRQGEGTEHAEVWDGDDDAFHPGQMQVAHYYRFHELKAGRRYRPGDTPSSGPTGEPILIDWTAVRPMRPNPSPTDHVPGTHARKAQDGFSRDYCGVLSVLEQTLNGQPHLLGSAIGAMYKLKAQAQALMEIPTGDGRMNAGPAFQWVEDRR